ncbi:neuronal pentraxin-2-like [Penaeus monodon]|uniref:neuronal pentraxin-2-like n=1 Tax=Penaeus monodon TaxID=6687 RepID=UPI0018A7E129|nr:neuronal pentraxin-2-like [Penaeus monodon]
MNLFLQNQRVRISTNVSTPLMVWSSWCFAFSTKLGTYDVFMNGERVTSGSWIPMRKVLLSSEEVAVLGQDQDVEGGGFDSAQSFSGELTAFNIWGRFLSEYEMTSVSSCGSLINGDIVSWNESRWTLTGDVREETRLIHETCEILPSPYFMFRDRLQFTYAVALCQV